MCAGASEDQDVQPEGEAEQPRQARKAGVEEQRDEQQREQAGRYGHHSAQTPLIA
jgi:hypothetical protein